MTCTAKSFLHPSRLSLILLLMLIPVAPINAQSGGASLLEGSSPDSQSSSSTGTKPTSPTRAETPNEDEAQKRATVAQLVKQGNDAYVSADYEDAIAAYSQALELYPQNAYAYYNRGNAHRKLKNIKAAFQDYTFSLRLNPENAYAHFYRGIVFTEVEEYENALQDLSSALKLTDQNPLIFEKRGEIYEKLKNEESAKEDYKKALDLYRKQGKERKAELLRRKIGLTGR